MRFLKRRPPFAYLNPVGVAITQAVGFGQGIHFGPEAACRLVQSVWSGVCTHMSKCCIRSALSQQHATAHRCVATPLYRSFGS